MSAYILDTETTDADGSEVIQLALMGPLQTACTDACTEVLHFRPVNGISIGAMATHNIIAEDLEGYPYWSGYILPDHCEYIIGHSIDFDWKAIGSPNVKRICTLALARSVWPDLDSHKLTALMYHIYPHPLARDLVRNAHDAGADVKLCDRLLLALFDVIDEPDSWEALWRISEEARIPKVFSFGKHYGASIQDIRRSDPSYISWCLSGKCDLVNDDPYLKQALTR